MLIQQLRELERVLRVRLLERAAGKVQPTAAGVALFEPARRAQAAIEDAVTMHEVGHLLGLVDLYLETGRADPEHPGHSRNTRSVMYWAVESNLVADLLTGGPPKDFDNDDLADLQSIRNSG